MSEEKIDNPFNLMTYLAFTKLHSGKGLDAVYKEYEMTPFPIGSRFRLTKDVLQRFQSWDFQTSVAIRLSILAALMEKEEYEDAHKVIVELDKLKDLYPAEKKQLEVNLPDLTSKIADVIGKTVTDKCPHCKKRLSLKKDTILELEKLSKGMDG